MRAHKSQYDDRISRCFTLLRGEIKSGALNAAWSNIWLQLPAVTEVGALLYEATQEGFPLLEYMLSLNSWLNCHLSEACNS